VATAAPEEQPAADARIASIYELYASSLRARCVRLTGDPLAAEDLMQEVFARFLARFSQVPSDMNVHGYLLATARNLWINHTRAERGRAMEEIDEARTSDDRLEHDPVRALLLDEQRALVRRGAQGLTGHQRRALAMRELDGRSYAEIGSDLGMGTNAVAQLVWRARGQLRRALRRTQIDAAQLPAECRARLDEMSDLVDRRSRGGDAELEAHIADCSACRRTLASYQEAGFSLRGAVPLLPLVAMMGRAATAVRGSVEASTGIGTVAAVTATVVATVGGGAIVSQHAPSSAVRAQPPAVQHQRQLPAPARAAPVRATAILVVRASVVHAPRPIVRRGRSAAARPSKLRARRSSTPVAAPIVASRSSAGPALQPPAPAPAPAAATADPPAISATPPVQQTAPAEQPTSPPGKLKHTEPAAAAADPTSPQTATDSAPPADVKVEGKAEKIKKHDVAPVPGATAEQPPVPPPATPVATPPAAAAAQPAPSGHGKKDKAGVVEPTAPAASATVPPAETVTTAVPEPAPLPSPDPATMGQNGAGNGNPDPQPGSRQS
jgi:RNA polymerase sigma factor (sigma-70 family)